MTRLATGFLVGAPVWLAIGVYIGLRLVWAEEPTYVEPEDGVQPVDPYVDGLRQGTWTDPETGVSWSWTGDSPARGYWSDPHLTTLTEGGKHP